MSSPIMQDLIRLVAIAAIGLGAFWVGLLMWGSWNDEWSGYNAQFRVSDGYCNIAVVPIVGDISSIPPHQEGSEDGDDSYPVAYVDDIVSQLRSAEYDPYIEGILVRIDSLGGGPVASEILADAIKASSLPVAAVIREYGTSGGYLAATAADTIFASPLSDIGSIGVTMSYLDYVDKNTKDGLSYVQLSSAPFKDYGDPNKPLTPAERELFERDLQILHEEFVKQVAANRALPLDVVERLADGSSMPGVLALENRLIDALGNQEATRPWFADKLGIPVSDIQFCE